MLTINESFNSKWALKIIALVSSGLDSCATVRHVVEKYGDLADGFQQFSQSDKDQKQQYLATKRSYISALASMKHDIDNVGE